MAKIKIIVTEPYEDNQVCLNACIDLGGAGDYFLENILANDDEITVKEQFEDLDVFIDSWKETAKRNNFEFEVDEEASDLMADLEIAMNEEDEQEKIDNDKAMKRSQN